MILTLTIWIAISIVSFLVGLSVLRVLRISSAPSSFPSILIFLAGLVGILFLGNLYSLFSRINLIFLSLLLVLALTPIAKKDYLKDLKARIKNTNWLITAPLTCVALILASSQTANVDEAGYYLPLIKWIEQYKVIPGSALFIARTGFNSGFHMLSAIFGFSSLYEGGIYELNGLLFIWFNSYFFRALLRLWRNESRHFSSDLLLSAALVFPFSFLIDSADSDYMVLMGGMLISALLLRQLESKKAEPQLSIIAVLIVMMLTTIKPFACLLACPLLVLLIYQKQHRALKLTMIASCIFIAPWLIRNIIMTGYPIFPVHFIDFFDFEWEMPKEMAVASYMIVEEYAKVQKIRLDYLLTGVESLSITEWFPTWLAYQKQSLIGWFTIIFMPISFVFSCFILLSKKVRSETNLEWFLGFVIIVLGLWFFNFPAVRFGWTWILTLITLSTSMVLFSFLPNASKAIPQILCALVIFSWGRLLYKSVSHYEHIKNQLVYPTSTTTDIEASESTIRNITIKTSNDVYCHGAAQPCKPMNNPYNIVPRGNTIHQGFKVEKE